jgi:hypothetical protein
LTTYKREERGTSFFKRKRKRKEEKGEKTLKRKQ